MVASRSSRAGVARSLPRRRSAGPREALPLCDGRQNGRLEACVRLLHFQKLSHQFGRRPKQANEKACRHGIKRASVANFTLTREFSKFSNHIEGREPFCLVYRENNRLPINRQVWKGNEFTPGRHVQTSQDIRTISQVRASVPSRSLLIFPNSSSRRAASVRDSSRKKRMLGIAFS